MSRKNTIGPEYFRLRDDERLQRTHEAMVDFINDRHPNRSLLDALSFGYRSVPELDRFAAQFTGYEGSSDEDYCDYDDDNDKYGIRKNNRYCGFNRNFLDRGLPDPSKHITAEEAERNAKALVDEEEKLKKKAEKKKQKKMRQKERRRLEKLEKENADKGKDEPVQVDPGSEKTKHADKDENENKIKNKTFSSVPSGPQRTSAPVQSSDSSSDEEDDKQKESTMEPEELDMNSCFVSNAAAIAKRKLEQKPKPDKKPQANSRKPHESEEKVTTTPQKQVDNKEELKSEETVNANYFITKSVEMAVLGNQYASSGDMEMAVKYFTEAIKHNPKEYKLFGNRSYCYEKMFEYEKALNDADIALSMNPKWIKGLYRKGKALVGLKRYFEARFTYGEVLKLDSSCKDAAEEIMRVQLVQLMEMGFTKQQSSNALILHGTVEKALESLSGLPGIAPVLVARENEFMTVERHPQLPAKFPLRPLPQNQPQPSMPAAASVHRYAQGELFPIWVGDLVSSITEAKLYKLFSCVGQVHSVRVLQMRHCAFVNYTNKEDCEKAIQDLNGYAIDGTTLVVRYPDRIHTRLGVSRDASTECPGKTDKQPDECYFWRTTGCLKNDRCTYKHIPENKGVDLHKAKSYI